jgi:ABC-type multidrug transport system fused ATPase/permease subunit
MRHNLLLNLFDISGAEPLRVSRNSDRNVSVGEVISFFREDASQIEDNVAGTNEVLGEGLFALISLLLLISINAKITMFIFLPLALIAATVHQFSDRIKRYRRDSRQSTQAVTGLLGEIFGAIQAIQVAGAETSTLKYLQQLCDRRRRMMVRDQILNSVLDSSFDNLVSLGTGAILLFAAQMSQSKTEALSVGDFALFVYYLSYVTFFLNFWGSFLNLSKQSEVSFERMAGLVNSHPQKLVAHHPLDLPTPKLLTPLLSSALPSSLTVTSPPSTLEPLQALKAISISYTYPDTSQGISNLSLHLERGSLTVITGMIGSGKTTLLQLLMGLLPLQSGAIYWNSQRIDCPDQFLIPPHAAYTPQVPKLFSGSLRENILLGMPYGEDQLRQAIALASFEQDLEAMPDGLNTQIGNKGMRLSGGQIQRIAAARMFIRQPELLV